MIIRFDCASLLEAISATADVKHRKLRIRYCITADGSQEAGETIYRVVLFEQSKISI